MVKFFDLLKADLEERRNIEARILNVISRGNFIQGEEVSELEARLADYVGSDHCLTVANGTDALEISLRALGISPGDEVILPAFSYIAAAEAVRIVGAIPVFADVSNRHFGLTARNIADRLTPKTRAIVSVNLYGHMPDYEEICNLCSEKQLFLIEDAAQSFGSTYRNKKSCTFGHISCTSFFPTKSLGCYGDGGAIFTNDSCLYEQSRLIARHGQRSRYEHLIVGRNSRLDTIQAAVLLEKLSVIDRNIQKRNEIAERYISNLSQVHCLQIPKFRQDVGESWTLFTVIAEFRDELRSYLTSRNIETVVHYPQVIYRQEAYKNEAVDCPVSEKLVSQVLSLPLFNGLDFEVVDEICFEIKSFYERR